MNAFPCNGDFRTTGINLSLEEHAGRMIARSMEDIEPILSQIEAWMISFRYHRVDRFAVNVVLREAVLHAAPQTEDSETDKRIQIKFAVRPQEVVIEVAYEGSDMAPQATPASLPEDDDDPNSGWGNFLANVYASWMKIDSSGTRFRFVRRRTEH